MKTKSIFILFLSLISIFYIGCGHKAPANLHPSNPESSLPAAETLLASEMLHHYYQLKDALVATRNKDADDAAGKMKASILRLRQELGNNKDSTGVRGITIQKETDSMLIQLDLILSVKDESCEVKRLYFKPLSNLTYRFLKTVDIKNIQAYHQYCPMALNEQGADWLSASPKIENPYFGQKMLTCGELIDTIK
jgi:Cu(I)/Ag(I) efflux system membrane fusion protein